MLNTAMYTRHTTNSVRTRVNAAVYRISAAGAARIYRTARYCYSIRPIPTVVFTSTEPKCPKIAITVISTVMYPISFEHSLSRHFPSR